jgi:hypothetical protein
MQTTLFELLVSLTPPWWVLSILALIAWGLMYGVTVLVGRRD